MQRHTLRHTTTAALVLALALAASTPSRAQDLAEIHQQMTARMSAGQLDQAARLARQGIQASEAQGDTASLASFSTMLGLVLLLQEKNREAEPAFRRAVGVFEKTAGPDSPAIPAILRFLGQAIQSQARYAEAEQTYRRALGIAVKLQPPNPGIVADLERAIVPTLAKLGKFAEAEERGRRALQYYERTPGVSRTDYIAVLAELAEVIRSLDRTDEAEALLKRALALAEATPEASRPPAGEPVIAGVLLNLSKVYADTDRSDEAGPLLKRALAVLLETVGPDYPAVANVRLNLGDIARYAGHYADAERQYRAALAIQEKAFGPDFPDLDTALHSLAVLRADHQQFAEAEALLRRAVALKEKAQGPDHPETARVVAELAGVCSRQGRQDEADRLFQRALAAVEKAFGPEHSEAGQMLYLMANDRYRQGKYGEADPLYRRSLAIAEKTAGAGSTTATYARFRLAENCRMRQRWDEALGPLNQVLARYEQAGEAPINRANALQARAQVLWNLKKADEALADVRRALDLADQQRGEFAGVERERATAFAGSTSAPELMVVFQSQRGEEQADVAAVFDAMERAHARTLFDEMQMAGSDLDVGRPPAERERLKARDAELKKRVRGLELKMAGLSGPNDPAVGPLEAELAEARNAVYEHYRDERSSSPTYRALLGRGNKLPTLAEVQKDLLRPGDLMLVYFFGRDIGAFLSITRDSVQIWHPEFDAREATILGTDEGLLTADRLRRTLLNDRGTGVVQRLANPKAEVPAEALTVLADTLLPPDQRKALTDGTIKRLIVVPDGPLALLPFEPLVVKPGADVQYLLDVGPPISYAPSAAVLKSLTERLPGAAGAGREPVLALGDPAYSDPGKTDSARGSLGSRSRWALAGGALPRLPYSAWEAQWVAKAFNDQAIPAVTLTAGTATEAGVRHWSKGRRVLHLACHGLMDQELGNFFGALALTPGPKADDPDDDGFLSLPEIHKLDLKSCELAILSACETNLSPGQTGEGTFALTRGFLIAGARRVVASDWLVDDEAAASLVSVYCTLLAKAEKEGKPVDYAGALRDAKRWVRGQAKWKSPFYWGPLVLVGPP